MGIIGRAFTFARERQLGKRVYDALLAPGRYEPAVTRTGAAGQTIVEREEIVEPKGVLRSRSILSTLVALIFVILDAANVDLGLGSEEATALIITLGELLGLGGAAWFRMIANMPTAGSRD